MYRLINLLCAVLLLVFLAPIMAVVAIAIRLDSKGPAIFKQTRVGQFDKRFTLYKFRTMHVGVLDLPSEIVPKDDDRFTRIGKPLRRFSIDELPQLFNVIKGNMNFAGPRPALYNQEILIAMRKKNGVNQLKPGITGWAQVNGRENISLERKVSLDKYYLDNRSWWLDVKILWLTVVKSLGGIDLYNETPANGKEMVEQSKAEQSKAS